MSDIWTVPGSPENPLYLIEGESITFSVKWEGATTATVSAISCFKDGVTNTSTAFPSGSTSESDNTVTWKPLVAGATDGGSTYVVVSKCTVDSNTEIRKTMFHILADEAES